MIDGDKILDAIERLKIAAKIPPIVDNGKYTMVVPYVELRRIIEGMEANERHTGEPIDTKCGTCSYYNGRYCTKIESPLFAADVRDYEFCREWAGKEQK